MRGAASWSVAWLLGLALLAGATRSADAQTSPLSCHGAQQAKLVAELIFGRDIGHRVGVSEAAWRGFVAREITPRFPDGFTVIDVSGQWRDPASKKVVREPSKLLMVVLPGHSEDQARLDAVVSAYKRRFHQQSVAMVVQPACAAF